MQSQDGIPEAVAGCQFVGMDAPELAEDVEKIMRVHCKSPGGWSQCLQGDVMCPPVGVAPSPGGENSVPGLCLSLNVLYRHFQAVQQISMSLDFNIDILLPFLYLNCVSLTLSRNLKPAYCLDPFQKAG